MTKQDSNPFKDLGVALKAFRVAANESEKDLCDALELNKKELTELEKGVKQPSTFQLELFVKHFSLRDKEAARLWELAGLKITQDKGLPKVVPKTDSKVLYTDMAHIISNKYGIVINFVQGVGQGDPQVVSRIGMSKDHAKFIADALYRSIEGIEAEESDLDLDEL